MDGITLDSSPEKNLFIQEYFFYSQIKKIKNYKTLI